MLHALALRLTFDILPTLKREDSTAGQRAGPTSPKATSRLPNGVRRGDTGFVRDTSAPRGVWRVQRPFGRGIRLYRASRFSQRDSWDPPIAGFPASGHGPCHRPACPSCGSRESALSSSRKTRRVFRTTTVGRQTRASVAFCLPCRHGLGDALSGTVW